MPVIEVPKPEVCGVVPLEAWKSMAGLEVLQAIIGGRLPPPPIAGLVGFSLVEASSGRAVFAGEPKFEHYNPAGSVHGGIYGVLLDSAMTCAVQTTVEAGWGCVTLEYKVQLVRPMTVETGLVRAEGMVLHPGKRTATAEGRIVDGRGKLLAHGSTTCMMLEL